MFVCVYVCVCQIYIYERDMYIIGPIAYMSIWWQWKVGNVSPGVGLPYRWQQERWVSAPDIEVIYVDWSDMHYVHIHICLL